MIRETIYLFFVLLFDLNINGTGKLKRDAQILIFFFLFLLSTEPESTCKCRSRGGQGVRTPPPLGKSKVIWVSIGNKQLDPPPPLEKVAPHPPPPPPPPPPWKILDPSGTLKNDSWLQNNKLRTKKKKKTDWPRPPLAKVPGSAHDLDYK